MPETREQRRERARRKREETSSNGDGGERKDVYRMSVSVDPSIRKKIRIAAAVNDMEVGEWAAMVLNKASATALKEAQEEEEDDE